MAEVRHEVRLRPVEDQDVEVFFDHQADPIANQMAAVPARDKDQFVAHWSKIRGDDTKIHWTIVVDGAVAGNIVSWEQDGQQMLGYWVGRDLWGRGIATNAVTQFLTQMRTRPLTAHVAAHNAGSIRVLEKCGFLRDHAQEAAAPPSDDGIQEYIYVLDALQP